MINACAREINTKQSDLQYPVAQCVIQNDMLKTPTDFCGNSAGRTIRHLLVPNSCNVLLFEKKLADFASIILYSCLVEIYLLVCVVLITESPSGDFSV